MNLIKETLLNEFNKKYSPNVTDNESEKIMDTINAKYEKNSQLATFIKSIINKRSNDPFIGSKIAGEEIFINLIEMLKNEKGVHAESLLAILGSLGGHECINGIISALRSVVSDDSPDKAKEKSAAALLDILMVETKRNETYVIGNRIGNTFVSFYHTAANDNTTDINLLVELSSKVTSKIGTDVYWETSFTDFVPESPQDIVKLFEGKFEQSLDRYCFSPQERMIAFALAAQKAVQQAEKIIGKQRSLEIIADYGWRTSHYLTRKGESDGI